MERRVRNISMETISEALFEAFCSNNRIECKRIPVDSTPTCDYEINIYGVPIHIEIKQIDDDQDLKKHDFGWSYLGKPGEIIRRRIEGARKQIHEAAQNGHPTILLIYNNLINLGPRTGTLDRDFTHGLYGEMTLRIKVETNEVSEPFHGKNRSLQEIKNTSFSAVGRIEQTQGGASIHLFGNMYARNKIDFSRIPSSITWHEVALEGE